MDMLTNEDDCYPGLIRIHRTDQADSRIPTTEVLVRCVYDDTGLS